MPNINYPDEELTNDENTMELTIEKRRVETEKKIYYALKKILAKPHAQMSQLDKDFLRARRSYLTKAELEEHDEIINEKTEPVEPALEDLTRSELDQKGYDLGIEDPEGYPNKTELIAAIRKAL